MELELLKWVALALLGAVVYFQKRTMEQTDKALMDLRASHAGVLSDIQNILDAFKASRLITPQ